MKQSDCLTPSLLEPQSRGGDNAEAGFLFQAHIILARIPVWLSQEGFTSVRPEGSADVDVKFFIPGHGFATELVEVKNHTLQPSEFWKEIQRFKELDTGSPSTYRRFTLVATSASKELEPLVNGGSPGVRVINFTNLNPLAITTVKLLAWNSQVYRLAKGR